MGCERYILTETGGRILQESGDGILHEIQLPQFVLTESGGKILQESGEQILLEIQNAVPVCLTGVSASPAIGVGQFNADCLVVGIAATPGIGEGTVVIGAGGAVFVDLAGVAANPQIGVGTVTGAEEEIIIGGFPAAPARRKRKVRITARGVSGDPQIGNVDIVVEVDLLDDEIFALLAA